MCEDGGEVGLEGAGRQRSLLVHVGRISNGKGVVGEVGAEEAFFSVFFGFLLGGEGSLRVFGSGGSVPEFHRTSRLGGSPLHIYQICYILNSSGVINLVVSNTIRNSHPCLLLSNAQKINSPYPPVCQERSLVSF